MPTIYLKKVLYDAIVQNRKDPNTFVNDLVEKAVQQMPEREGEGKSKKQEG